MAQITVKYDPSLKIEEIEDPMYATSNSEDPENQAAEVQQTKITGILTPLIKINNIIILWSKVTRFELNSIGTVPQLSFTFIDDNGFVKSLDQPGNDNLVIVQILPPFDNAYKKINLRFYISDISISGSKITLSCIYNVPKLYQDTIKGLGKLTTYGLMDKIAKESELGFASNLEGTEDERYVYISNSNFLETIEKEIKNSGNETCIMDSWIDLHNYLVLCDIRERYNTIDEDIKVWSMPLGTIDINDDDKEIEPIEYDAVITNSGAMRTSQLYIKDYRVKNSSGTNVLKGTDKIVQTYNMSKLESESILIQDGDSKNDIFLKTIYNGELFGDYDYLNAKIYRSAYLQKISTNTIEVDLNSPLLGLERGGKVNIQWYDDNEIINSIKEDYQEGIQTNTPTEDGENDDISQPVLNKQVSGQYLIIGTRIRFQGWDKGWKYTLILSRPADQVNTYISNE